MAFGNMKITKKVPIKPRGRAEEKRHIARDAIREAYTQPQKDVKVIPARRDLIPEDEKKKLRVCAYCRVSTEEESQEGSYELQVQHYIRVSLTREEQDSEAMLLRDGWNKYNSYMNRQIDLILTTDWPAAFEKQHVAFGKVDASFIIRNSFGALRSVV